MLTSTSTSTTKKKRNTKAKHGAEQLCHWRHIYILLMSYIAFDLLHSHNFWNRISVSGKYKILNGMRVTWYLQYKISIFLLYVDQPDTKINATEKHVKFYWASPSRKHFEQGVYLSVFQLVNTLSPYSNILTIKAKNWRREKSAI